MGLTLTLTDAEIPASPAFIEFLYASLTGETYHTGEWYAQEKEGLARDRNRFNNIEDKAKYVLAHKEGKALVIRSYRYFKEMLTGRPNTLRDLAHFRFYFIIGIPRTGGTYLTKQLFRACQIDYTAVQNALAHDGFPHIAPLSFSNKGNIHTTGLLQLAEYLTMVQLYFGKSSKLTYKNSIVVPKKFTKAIYNFPLIQELFGTNATYLITLRHPLAMTQSIIDKSGGMPEGKKFSVRSTIERWALEDWQHWGETEAKVRQRPYVDVMLEYWKRFHFHLALAGIPRMPSSLIIPFGKEPMEDAASGLFKTFKVGLEPEAFKISKPPKFTKSEQAKAETAIRDVASFWESLGAPFPTDALSTMQ